MPASPRARADALSPRALNRATLARQRLLSRSAGGALDVIEAVGGLQAQLPRPPYVGLWSRVAAFERGHLTDAALDARVARGTLQRVTLHVVTARDYRWMRPTLQPMLDAGLRAILGARLDALDLDAVVADGARIVRERPRPFDEIRARLVERHPGMDERAMGYAVRCLLPLVQLPATGEPWGWNGKAPFGSAEALLGPVDAVGDVPRLVRRYLAAFGPATPADFTTWSGLRGAREAFAALDGELVVHEDADGRRLFDVPGAPLPDADAPAPVRYLPEYDNLLLAHADRTRVIPEALRPRLASKNLQVPATVLLDGMVAGAWRSDVKRGVATVTVQPWVRVSRAVRAELEAEGQSLALFVHPEAKAHAVAVLPPA